MFYILLIALIAIPFLMYYMQHQKFDSAQKAYKDKFKQEKNSIPKFNATDLPYRHQFVEDGRSMPFLDVKIIHPYDDDRAAIFETGGDRQLNGVLLYENGAFKDIASELNLGGRKDEAAYCMAYADIDNDGKKEIIIGYESGVYMHKRKPGEFSYDDGVKLFDVPDITIPVDIALADTRGTGMLDMYVCTFVDREHFTSAVYHNDDNKRRNLFMLNNGDGTFSENTEAADLKLVQNSYLVEFVDFNNNGRPDIVLALNTDKGYIYENLGDGTFKQHLLPIEYGFWMGLDVKKLNKDTDKYSILMSNIGKSFPAFMVRGDLKKDEIFEHNYALLEQVEDFKFKNITHQSNLNSNVFGWGVLLEDLNNNGRMDAVLTENYIKFPAKFHKHFPSDGKLFLQNSDGTFAPFQKESGLVNPHFGYRVISYDFSKNGYQDVIIGNVNSSIRYFLNSGVNTN